MLLILDLCFLGACIISWLLIFPGPDITNIKEAIKVIESRQASLDVIEEEPIVNITSTFVVPTDDND